MDHVNETVRDAQAGRAPTLFLMVGLPGSGKTVIGLQFAFGGARLGEPAVFASLLENRVQLERTIRGLSWSSRTGPGTAVE